MAEEDKCCNVEWSHFPFMVSDLPHSAAVELLDGRFTPAKPRGVEH